MERTLEYTFTNLRTDFDNVIATLQQAEKCIETEKLSESIATTHAKAVYCVFQLRRLVDTAGPKIQACVQARDWQQLTFCTHLNSDVLTRKPFRDAVLEVLRASESEVKTALLLKRLLKSISCLAERMRHIKSLNVTEAHFSIIALIKLNRILELRNFETLHDNQYEEFGIHNKSIERLDMRIENTCPRRKLPAASPKLLPVAPTNCQALEKIEQVQVFLKSIKHALDSLEGAFFAASQNSLRYAQSWADFFDEDQRDFGVRSYGAESYVLKCQKELRECGPFSVKVQRMSRYVEEILRLVQDWRRKRGVVDEETLRLILQQVEAASHVTLRYVLQITGKRIHDLVGPELVQRYRNTQGKEMKFPADPEPKLSRSNSRVDKGIRFMLQVATNLKTSTKNNIRGMRKKRDAEGVAPGQVAEHGKPHKDIVLEYLEAIQFTLALMTQNNIIS